MYLSTSPFPSCCHVVSIAEFRSLQGETAISMPIGIRRPVPGEDACKVIGTQAGERGAGTAGGRRFSDARYYFC